MTRWLAAAVVCLLAASSIANARDTLKPPFDVAAIQAGSTLKPKKKFECKAPPAPVKSIAVESKYAPGSGSNEIDPERLAAYKQAMKGIRAFTGPLVGMGNDYVARSPSDPRQAVCVVAWLAHWAEADAMSQPRDRRGEAVRAWTLPILALAYLEVSGERTLDAGRKAAVESWLRRLSQRVKGDFSADQGLASRRNNHRYWAAWAVMTASIALDDRAGFDWAVASGRMGADAVRSDGFLPLELERKQRSLGYHLFATEALVMLANAAALNGVDLFAENDRAIERLASRTIDSIADPSAIERAADVPQEMNVVSNPSKIAWAWILSRRHPSAETTQALKGRDKLASPAAGGDVKLLYP